MQKEKRVRPWPYKETENQEFEPRGVDSKGEVVGKQDSRKNQKNMGRIHAKERCTAAEGASSSGLGKKRRKLLRRNGEKSGRHTKTEMCAKFGPGTVFHAVKKEGWGGDNNVKSEGEKTLNEEGKSKEKNGLKRNHDNADVDRKLHLQKQGKYKL